jgi:myosin protein heavy chain/myosin heavy chain 6/7
VEKERIVAGNATRYDRCEDIAELSELNEATVLNNLRQRYDSGLIYVLFPYPQL